MLDLTDEKLIKIEVVAERLNVSGRTVNRWITEKGLPAYKPGRDFYLLWSEVQKWLKGCKYESHNTDSG